ncbi:MAG TPA: hypothetical protein VFV72_11610 [Candidatus Limnocylindrales bacterium]|nr:hypothetical protein [Candidatus Limnocylindrales bacterium]
MGATGRRLAIVVSALLMLSLIGVVPTMAAGNGTVDAQVTIARAAACLEISTSAVDFGTLGLGAEDAPGTPNIDVTNCGDGYETLLASGANATGTTVTWNLVDSAATCATTLGTDNYRLGLSTPGGAPIAGLATENKAVATLARDESATHSARIWTACPGSSGTGAVLNMQINYLVTNLDFVLEELTANQATADAVGDFLLGGDNEVPVAANCASVPAIGCVGGVPSDPAGMLDVVGHSVVMTPGALADTWDGLAHVGVTTQAPVPITYQGTNCTLSADTALGANPDVTVTGKLTFKSHPNVNGPKNYVEVSNTIVSGLDTADLSVGGGGLCSLASVVLPSVVPQVEDAIAASLNGNVCGDPLSDAYIACPPLQ